MVIIYLEQHVPGQPEHLKAGWKQKKKEGTIRVYGCPAEEIVIGKIRMNEAGVFDDLSAAITWHPFDRNRVSYDIWQAQDIKNYKFYGKAAHASKHPEMGRSAFDAAELMNVGANYLREHVADDVRMHYNLCSIRMVRLILYRHILQQIILSAQQSGREQKMHLRG